MNDQTELQELLQSPDGRTKLRESCFRQLSQRPGEIGLRLFLAQSFYLDEMPEFCARELLEIKKRKTSPALEKLLEALGSFALHTDTSSELDSKVMAEVDLDTGFLEALREVTKDK